MHHVKWDLHHSAARPAILLRVIPGHPEIRPRLIRVADRQHSANKMRTAPNVLTTIIAIIAAVGVLRYFAKEHFFAWLFVIALMCAIVDGLWERTATIGLRHFIVSVSRSSSPLSYWSILSLYFVLVVVGLYSLCFAGPDEVIYSLFR